MQNAQKSCCLCINFAYVHQRCKRKKCALEIFQENLLKMSGQIARRYVGCRSNFVRAEMGRTHRIQLGFRFLPDPHPALADPRSSAARQEDVSSPCTFAAYWGDTVSFTCCHLDSYDSAVFEVTLNRMSQSREIVKKKEST
jgi:hypothetical protein